MTTFKSQVLAGALALGLTASSFVIALPAAAAGNGPGNGSGGTSVVQPAPISAEESAGLSFMREEEKLARDVYTTLGSQWGLAEFSNIAASEQKHMDAIATLLTRYGVADPAAGNGAGEFTNAELQALYDQLVEMGSQSAADALKVGALIEETDIEDLLGELASVTHSDIERVYTQLNQGSENHLRAFAKSLQTTSGEVYVPQVLDQATYDAILSGSNGGSRGGRQGNAGGQGQQPGRGSQAPGNNQRQFQGRGQMQGQGDGTCTR